MLYISRSRSLSVRTVPLTRATGLPDACGAEVVLAGFTAPEGACEETICPNPGILATSSTAQIVKRYFITSSQKKGGRRLSPEVNTPGRLGRRDNSIVQFVGL